jgi:general secretion pathway protein D
LPPAKKKETEKRRDGEAAKPESPITDYQLPVTDFVLSDGARIIPDPEQGAILVLGTANDLTLIERIIPEIDRPIVQVLIESVIVEVNLGKHTAVGVEVLQREFTKKGVTGAGVWTPSGTFPFPGKTPATITDPTKLSDVPLTRGLNYWLTFGGLDLDAAVQAIATSSAFKLLQTPMIQSSQNEKAHVFIGETRPIITSTVTGFTSDTGESVPVVSAIEQFDIGITLDITPVITPGGLVMLDVSQAVEDVTGSVTIDDNEQPIIARRQLNSRVSVKDRGVVVLGGLIRNDRTKTESKVPFLGDLPLLGIPFLQTTWRNNRNELVVLIRPTVLRTADAAQTEAQKLREKVPGLEEVPAEKLPPLPKEEAPPEERHWYDGLKPPEGS